MAGKGKSAPRRKRNAKKKHRQTRSNQSVLPYQPVADLAPEARDEDAAQPDRTDSACSSTTGVRQALSATEIVTTRKRGPNKSEEEPPAKRRNEGDMPEESETDLDVSVVDVEHVGEFSEGSSYEGDTSQLTQDDSVFVDENSCAVQNEDFAMYLGALNEAVTAEPVNVPPQLTEELCDGGDPGEAWNIMCKKDELNRASPSSVSSTIKEHSRAVLVDWMMELCENEKQHRETFHLAVNYLDRFLDVTNTTIPLEGLQCMGTAALLIASKYEEIYPPKLEQLVEYTDGACTEEEVQDAELLVLGKLGWTISLMTPIHWLHMFFRFLGGNTKEEDGHVTDVKPKVSSFLRDQYVMAARVLDVAVLDVDHLQFSARQLAAAVLFLIYEPYELVQKVTGYAYDDMVPVIEWVKPCLDYCLKKQTVGDPLPIFSEVRSEEWHSIQTHVGIVPEEAYHSVREERRAEHVRITEAKKKIQQRAPPLRVRAPNITGTT